MLTRTLSAIAVAVALACSTAACGGDDATDEPAAQATPTKVETPKTWPPKGAEGELATYPYLYEVSWQAPREWKFERSDDEDGAYALFIWSKGAKGKEGTMSVSVQNSRSTAEEWEALIHDGMTGVKEIKREEVDVPGYGKGIHTRMRVLEGGTTRDSLVVTSIDGVLLELSVNTPKGGDLALADELVAGVKRGADS